MRYLNSEQLVAKDKGNISELVDAIYFDMAGMGLLSPYLQDTDTDRLILPVSLPIIITSITLMGKSRLKFEN